ncbi:MAG: anthranilate phosphoribosyltransferase [Eubacteriaceae bacterium]|nr:anthranilate phosphoribosyltransferase [Eubacteriaceae bacterium]
MDSREFGRYISRLINRESLSREEMLECSHDILENRQSGMQQGAFLAALAAKGETAEEIAAAWQAIYELDTAKVSIKAPTAIIENSGTGMDTLKTFNISTAASVIAASDSVPMARHGSRAITSKCGSIDIIEELGVNVECHPEIVKKSIETCSIGIFNGMSPLVHPNGLSRMLSQISFGTVLNTAASLANPAFPKRAVRGVSSVSQLIPTAMSMAYIGFERALVVCGVCDEANAAIDEASTMGSSYICELTESGDIFEYEITPESFGIKRADALEILTSGQLSLEAERMKQLLSGEGSKARIDIACLNAALIFYISGREDSIANGFERASELAMSAKPLKKLEEWILIQQ